MSKTIQEISPERYDILMTYLERFVDTITGRKSDIKGRHQLFTNPDTPETSTNLSAGEVSMIASFLYVSQFFPEFECAGTMVREYSRASLSKDGFAVRTSVESHQLSETKLSRLNVITNAAREVVSGESKP